MTNKNNGDNKRKNAALILTRKGVETTKGKTPNAIDMQRKKKASRRFIVGSIVEVTFQFIVGSPSITPSSAAVFRLWFYGILLRSKTIKQRLKNYPVRAAHDAATTCYAFDSSSSAISWAISSIVCVAVLLATLSASEGLNSITCCLVILCQMGSKTCSPETVLVTIPSSS